MDCRDAEALHGDWFEGFDETRMVISIALFDDNGDEELVEFPAKYEVCGLCNGRGAHVNPSIDAHGISGEEFAEDPEFAENYMTGVYDVACYRCGGDRVEAVVDEIKTSEELLARLHEYERALANDRREQEAEARWGL